MTTFSTVSTNPQRRTSQTDGWAGNQGFRVRGHGLSGCTFEEAQSWRKIAPDADFVTVNVEATVAVPLIVSALADDLGDAIGTRPQPQLDLGPSARGER